MVHRWRYILRVALVTVAALLTVAVGGIVVSLASIDPDSLKPLIIEAIQRTTGRDLQLNGPIQLTYSIPPRIQVSDVAITNPPGFSRPMLATLQRLDLELVLLPLLLHRVDIARLVLTGADVLLETNAAGEPNWHFHLPADHAMRIGITDAAINGGTIAYRDARSGRVAVLAVDDLALQAASFDAPLHLTMRARANGEAFSLTGVLGPLSRLQAPLPGAPWPVNLELAAAGATMTIDGSIGDPTTGRQYALQVNARAADIAPLAVFLPGASLPPLHDASAAVRLTDTDAGLTLDATLRLGAISLAAKGVIADIGTLAGVDIALHASAADLHPLDALAEQPLPPLQSIDFQARLTEAAGGLASGLALRDIKLTSAQADVTGDAVAEFAARPSLHAKLAAARIDVDALRRPGNSPHPAHTQSTGPGPVIPDTPLPFGLLRAADADVAFAIGSLQSRGIVYQSLAARLTLQDGRLLVAPFTVDLPEGRLIGTLDADARQAEPRLLLTLHAPGLDVAPLLAALGLPVEASGKLGVSLELHGSGSSAHAIAAGLNGHAGLAMVQGTVSNWLMANTVGWVLREADLTGLAAEIGTSDLSCFALRMNFTNGVGDLRSLLLDSSSLYLYGRGTVRLDNETVDLHLQPEPMLAGVGVIAPVYVFGPLADPSVGPEPIVAAEANAGMLVGAAEWFAAPVGWAAESLGIIAPRAPTRGGCSGSLSDGRATEAALQPLPPVVLPAAPPP